MTYSFSGGTTSPVSIAASDLSGFSVTGGGGADTLTINGGSPTLLNDAGADGTSLSVEITTGSTLNFDATQHLTALNIDTGATATLLGNGSRALVTNSLTIAGSTDNWTGQLDLTNNDLIVHTGNLATLTNQAKSGFANGQWNGQGIIGSAAANNISYLTALGVIQNSTNGSPTGTRLYPSFASQTAVNTDVLVGYTFYGDANLNGHVDGSDYSRIDSAFVAGGVTGWFNGDFNYDGLINGSDYTLIDNAFNTQPSSATAPTIPPQPTGLTIIQAITGEFDLQWSPSPDPGVVTYNVYSGTDPNFYPNSGNQVASAVSANGDSDYFDTDPSLTWYYKITAVNTSAQESVPSATVGASMPASTPDDYQDNPPLYTNDSVNGSAVAVPAQISKPSATPADAVPTNLFAFYGAGPDNTEGNVDFGNSPDDGVAGAVGHSIVTTLGATEKSDHLPYTDWGMDKALHDFATEMDTNNDHVISAAEIAAQNIKVLGYSWGAIEATNFTEQLAVANPDTMQIDITTDPAWLNKSIRRYFGKFDTGVDAYGRAKGSDIQHDTIVYYIHDQVISDIQSG